MIISASVQWWSELKRAVRNHPIESGRLAAVDLAKVKRGSISRSTCVSFIVLCSVVAVNCFAAGGCNEWSADILFTNYYGSPEEAMSAKLAYCNSSAASFYDCTRNGFCQNGWENCGPMTGVLVFNAPNYYVDQSYTCTTTAAFHAWNGTPVGTDCSSTARASMIMRPHAGGCYYCAATSKGTAPADNGSCKSGQTPPQSCADPINPSNGDTYKIEQDLNGTGNLTYRRHYNSTAIKQTVLGTGWRGAFSRSIFVNKKIASFQPLSNAGSTPSSLYSDESSACTSGFAQIQPQVPTWAGAIASFSNGVCNLTKSGVSIGALPIYDVYSGNFAESSPPSFDYNSDDGQIIRFSVINGEITAPPGAGLKLVQTASGYTLTDGSDNVEQYNAAGQLLSVTSRAGVVQTMSYDSSGRLSGVTDNFGHQLNLGYDAQNRLISVTRQ